MFDVLSFNNVDFVECVFLIIIFFFICVFILKDSKDVMVCIDGFICGGLVCLIIVFFFIDGFKIDDIDDECVKKLLLVLMCCGFEVKINVFDD